MFIHVKPRRSTRCLSVSQIIMDGTQDISGVKQVSICIRYVDTDLEPREEFVGLYEASSTTGEQIGKIASDVLLRLNLPFSSLRGQTYDGAANMSGHLSGAQAHIRREQLLATFVHLWTPMRELGHTSSLFSRTNNSGFSAMDP